MRYVHATSDVTSRMYVTSLVFDPAGVTLYQRVRLPESLQHLVPQLVVCCSPWRRCHPSGPWRCPGKFSFAAWCPPSPLISSTLPLRDSPTQATLASSRPTDTSSSMWVFCMMKQLDLNTFTIQFHSIQICSVQDAHVCSTPVSGKFHQYCLWNNNIHK